MANGQEGLGLRAPGQPAGPLPAGSEQMLQQAYRLHREGRLEEAERLYRAVLSVEPDNGNALHLFGVLKAQRGELAQAAELIGRATIINPHDANAFYNHGNALRALKRLDEALANFDRALKLMPGHVECWSNRGVVLLELGAAGEALQSFERGLALDPQHIAALLNRANALRELKRPEEALVGYDRVVLLKPDLAEAHNGRGALLQELRRYPEALASYEKAYRLDPGLPYVEGRRLHVKMAMGDWSNLDVERAQLNARAEVVGTTSEPFELLSLSSSARAQRLCAEAFLEDRFPAAKFSPLWRGERYAHDKIRVEYVSGEFRAQATSYLTAGLFESHDRDQFELTAIATGPNDQSPMRRRLEAAFDRFHDVSGERDAAIAQLIRAAEIDILVNLNGYFGAERTGVFAFRPSPIQINYLGFPGTMGAPFMDYIIADRIVIPEDQQEHYAEKVAYLPHSYQPNDRKRPIATKVFSRAECGLPDDAFVFCCFNNTHKLTPEFFDIWMRLVAEIKGSVLWLFEANRLVQQNLKREAEKRGIAAERIVFAPVMTLADHLSRGRCADLFLDTLPHNAHTTASDALWCGVPVLTCLGSTFAGRVAASLLEAAGLPDLITRSLEDYESLALKLAREGGTLAALKARLMQNRDTVPLFDTQGYTRSLETAYRMMWERRQRGEPPASFAVEADR